MLTVHLHMCVFTCATCVYHPRLWLQPLSVRSGLVPPSAAAARQTGGSDAFKMLRRVVVVSGRVARPGAKGQREEWAVKFEGIKNREEVSGVLMWAAVVQSLALPSMCGSLEPVWLSHPCAHKAQGTQEQKCNSN